MLDKDVQTPAVTPLTEVYTASRPRHERSTHSVTLPWGGRLGEWTAECPVWSEPIGWCGRLISCW